MSGLQIADCTSSKGRGWINVMQVMRINARRSRAGVQENPRREVELIPRQQMSHGVSQLGDFNYRHAWGGDMCNCERDISAK